MKRDRTSKALLAVIFGLITVTLAAFGGAQAAEAQSGRLMAAWPYPYWHDSTSDAVLQDALPGTGRMLVLYYTPGDQQCQRMKNQLDDVCRFHNEVRYYMVDVTNDTDPRSRTRVTPTVVMLVPARADGHLILLSSLVGYADRAATFDFFQKGLRNPAACQPSTVPTATQQEVMRLVAHGDRPVVALYCSKSLLSRLYQQVFDQVSQGAYGSDFIFRKVMLPEQGKQFSIPLSHRRNLISGEPAVIVYQKSADGVYGMVTPISGFENQEGLESLLQQIMSSDQKQDKNP